MDTHEIAGAALSEQEASEKERIQVRIVAGFWDNGMR